MLRSHCVLAALLLVTTVARTEEKFEVLGSYGFNWSKPKSAQCVKVGEAETKQLKSCEFHSTGAFGLPIAYQSCPRTKGGELLAFKNLAECKEALETMRANGP